MNTIFGRKIKQTQGFLENGTRVPVTVIASYDSVVTDVKTQEKNGYSALQIGLGKAKKSTKPLLGHVKKANLTHVPFLMKEVRVDEATFQLGDHINIDEVLKPGDIIDVTGTSKGKGFAGGVKRYHFRGGPRTHGQSDRERAPGSIGQTTTPGRVYKGKRMAGNMGREQVTVKNLLVLDVKPQTILVKGLVPGIIDSTIEITKVGEVKEKNYVPLLKNEEEVLAETPIESTTEGQEVVVDSAPVEESSQEVTETPVEETEEKKEEAK